MFMNAVESRQSDAQIGGGLVLTRLSGAWDAGAQMNARPGQKGQCVPVLGADMMLPSGPAKLALASGAPIVPVFCVRMPSGKVRLCVEPAIEVPGPQDVDRAMEQLAAVVGKYIRAHGEQWLMLQPAWCDQAPSLTV